MEMFIGGGEKMDKHIVRNTDSRDVELYFFELMENDYKELQAMLDDYLDLYNAFNEYQYRMNALIIMEVLRIKKDREVNVS